MPNRLEVCVTTAASASAAERGGADRVELCDDLSVGGVTPTPAEARDACRRLTIPVHVLIRPRAGDFVYAPDEFDRMLRQIDAAKSLGASGIVLGLLADDGSVDLARTSALVARSRPLSVTFHKAFDETPDPFDALDALAALGVDRVLTSGQAPTARAGLPLLARLVRHARGRIAVMAGGSLTPADVSPLLAAGLDELHTGSAVLIDGATDPAKVRAFADLLNNHGQRKGT